MPRYKVTGGRLFEGGLHYNPGSFIRTTEERARSLGSSLERDAHGDPVAYDDEGRPKRQKEKAVEGSPVDKMARRGKTSRKKGEGD